MNPKPFLYPNNDQKNPFTVESRLPTFFARIGKRISKEKFVADSGTLYLLDESGNLLQSFVIGAESRPLPFTLVELEEDTWYGCFLIDQYNGQWVTIMSSPIRGENNKIYYLVIQANDQLAMDEIKGYILGLQISLEVECEQNRTHEMLFQITKNIYSSMDVDQVLHSIEGNISVLYPKLKFELWLSNDSFTTTLPVKPFNFNANPPDFSLQAFMEGKVIVHKHTVEDSISRKLTLAAPLRGKQGIYGVLELYTEYDVDINEKDVEYIAILADIAGNAFENAQLYLQSQKLIRELLLINEMVQQLNKSLVLKDILSFVLEKLIDTYNAEYCAILRKGPSSDKFMVCAATDEVHRGIEITANKGVLGRILWRNESIILSNCTAEEERNSFFKYKSLLGVPLVSGSEVEGALLISDSRPDFFSFDDFKLLEVLAQHMNLAIKNASLHNEVERMVITDTVTGLYNRKYLNEFITKSLRTDVRGSLILMDIDFFKRVNDIHGHITGDLILKQVSNMLKLNVRSKDIAARWGGEELAVYLPSVKKEAALEVAERIRKKIMEGTSPQVTISSGIAYWSAESNMQTVESLFHTADMALYEAKHLGRNQVCMAK